MTQPKTAETNWLSLNHEVPEGYDKYVVMLAEACGADNELKLITRFQKVVRLIHDEKVAQARRQVLEECHEIAMAHTKPGWQGQTDLVLMEKDRTACSIAASIRGHLMESEE